MSLEGNYSFKFLKGNKLIPSNVSLLKVNSIKNKCIELDEFIKLSDEDRSSCSKHVIASNSVWVAATKDFKKIFSSNGIDTVYLTSKNNRMISCYKVEEINGMYELVLKKPISLIREYTRIKEEVKMDTNMDNVNLDEAMGAIAREAAATGASVGTSNSFGTTKKAGLSTAEKERRHEQLVGALSTAIQGVQVSNIASLAAFNRKHGKLLGYVTNQEPKIMASTVGVVQLDNSGKAMLTAEAMSDPNVRELLNRGGKLPASKYVKIPKLVLKESAPTTPQGVIFTIPKGGIKTSDEITSGKPITFDENEKDLVLMSKPKDEAIFMFINLFGGAIHQEPSTHDGSEDTVTAKVDVAMSKKLQKSVAKLKLEATLRKRLVTAHNFLPRKVNKTVRFSELGKLGEQEYNELLMGMFYNLVVPGSTGKSKRELMDEESKSLFSATLGDTLEDTKFTSTLINPQSAAPEIKQFWGDGVISDPEFPVKVVKPASKPTATKKFTTSAVTFDVLNPNPDLRDLDPAVSGKYRAMVNALGGRATVADVVKSVIKTKGKAKSKTSQRQVMDNKEAIAFLANAAKSNTAGIDLSASIDYNDIDNALASLKY